MFLSFFRKTLGNNKETKDVEEQKQIKAEEIKDMIYGNYFISIMKACVCAFKSNLVLKLSIESKFKLSP